MIKRYFRKLTNLIVFIITRVIVALIVLQRQKKNSKTLLLIRLDLIGDYILFRNFISFIKESYPDYKITLCGNIVWKDLAEWLDTNDVHEFIWINKKQFYRNIFYKSEILNKIHKSGFEVVIHSTFTREILYGDFLVYVSCAPERIGSSGSLDKHSHWKRNLFSDRYYTRLIPAASENVFEFYRNKEFFENVLKKKIEIQKPVISYSKPAKKQFNYDFVLFVIGASELRKQWDVKNFVKTAEFILTNSDKYVIVAGSLKERSIAEIFVSELNRFNNKVFNKTGQTNLRQFVDLIAESNLLISNETSSIHIAAALNKSFVCISNGNYYGRFDPYPDDLINNSYYIYPDVISDRATEKDSLTKVYQFGSNLDVNSITSDKVINVIKKILAQHNISHKV